MNRYPHPESAPMRAVEHIRKHGTQRSPGLAEVMGVPEQDVSAHLKPAVRDGLLVTCKVEVHTPRGVRQQNEYRLGAGGKPRAWRDFAIRAPLPTRPNAADHLAAAADAREASTQGPAPSTSAAQAGEATAPAADEPGVSAPNNPGSVPAELATALSQAASSAAGHASPAPSPRAGEGPGERAAERSFGEPFFMMDSDICLTIAAGDKVLSLEQPAAAHLFEFLNRFADRL